MMQGLHMHRARVLVSVVATAISLACGTNYVYSAWAPQFADRLQLSSTESNLIGLWGNMGMYALGFPIGLLVDSRGPRLALILGGLLLALGYFPLHEAYDRGFGSVPLFCFFSSLTGLGSCMTFQASIKTSALNWPHHRGTATAFPIAAFGLSAFFFSTLGAVFFEGDTSAFLMLLSAGTSGLIFIGLFFIRVLPYPSYQAVPGGESSAHRRKLSDGSAEPAHPHLLEPEPGMSSHTAAPVVSSSELSAEENTRIAHTSLGDPEASAVDTMASGTLASETTSLLSPTSPLPGEILARGTVDRGRRRADIRGLLLLSLPRFWQLFALLGILSGIGLMTINNIGNVVKALWRAHDDTASEAFVIKNQQLHVSILSLCSFFGRLLSGVGSDFLIKVLHANRVWCLVAASSVFAVAQIFAVSVANPNLLSLVSGTSGLAYGFLFGVFPSIVAETFGVNGLSQNWGILTLAPAVSGNVFNILYGRVYDSHSSVTPGGQQVCGDGLECYRSAYMSTLGASVMGLVLSLWVIRRERQELDAEDKGAEED